MTLARIAAVADSSMNLNARMQTAVTDVVCMYVYVCTYVYDECGVLTVGVLTASAVWAYMIRDELFLFVSEVRDEMLPVNSALHAHITQLEKRIEQIDKQKK